MKNENKSLLRRYFLLSMGFGILMGAVFPVFAGLFTVYREPEFALPFTLLCILAGIIVGLVAYLIGKITILRALDRVSRHIRQVSQSGDVTRELELVSRDRLGEIVRDFNFFTGTLNSLLSGIKTSFSRTASSSRELRETAGRIRNTAGQIQTSLENTDRDFDGFNRNLEEASETYSRLNGNIELIGKQIDGQSETLKDVLIWMEENSRSVHQLTTLTQNRRESIALLNGSLRKGAGQMGELTALITRLSENTRTVLKSLQVIYEITDRTSLLSLNAAIEAARAGAAGRGFAVVSQEIRKLSSETEARSGEIRESLERTEQTLEEMKNAGAVLEESFHRIESETGVVGNALEEMLDSFDQLSHKDERLSLDNSQLYSANQQILGQAEHIRSGLGELDQRTDSFGKLSRTLNRDIRTILENLDTIITDLNQLEEQSSVNRDLNSRVENSLSAFQTGQENP